uniref:Uncharacterized protein n=1 Tax=viral metagenome TaxID=1070528 RepID=A0A6M3J420_9ZZZZ
MPISNYPKGFANGINVRGVPILNTYGGNVFWVDSGAGSNGYKGTFDRPFATIDYAIGRCTANNGDIIIVKPGHAETVLTAGGIALDVAGVSIIGLGVGQLRPTVTFTTDADADVDMSAANCLINNMIFKCNIANQVAMITVSAAGCEIAGCEFSEGSATGLSFITTAGAANACDDLYIHDNYMYAPTAGNYDFGIELEEVEDSARIENNTIIGDFDSGGIHNPTGKVCTHLQISRNIIHNLQTGQHAIELVSACTGAIVNNRLYGDTIAAILDPGSCICNGNLAATAIDESGLPIPAVGDSTDNYIGTNSNNNDADSSNVVANKDGSILERLEDISGELSGTAGIATFPAAAAAANAVSIAEVLRYMSELQIPRIVLKESGDLTAFGTSKTLFTVTGDVLVKVGASVDVAVTSTSGTTTLEVGVAGNTAALCVQDAVDNTAFAIGDSWSLITAADANGAQMADEWLLVGNGVDIILTGSVDDITAGEIDFYCQFIPLTAGSSVVAAA